jgi:ABC-2 type transport system permease protein
MNRPVSRVAIIGSIVRKDLGEYMRDRLWAFLTIMVLVVVVALYWILPDDVEESIGVGVAGLGDPTVINTQADDAGNQGLAVVAYPSEEALAAVVAGEARAWASDGEVIVIANDSDESPPEGAESADVAIGIAFPDDFLIATASGSPTQVTVYADAAVPEEIESTISALIREIAFTVAGEPLPVTTADPTEVYVVLGEDRVGDQVSAREGFRPIFVFLVLVMEMFVMASLIAKEIQDRTVTAMLVTPARLSDVLTAKGMAGAISGMTQAVIILIAINSLGPHPVLVLTLMLLGSIMVSGTAMIAGSTGKDFMTTLFYGMAFMIPLLIPAFAALFPGTASTWIQLLPSYPLVDGLVEVVTYGAGWADVLPQLGLLLIWCVALFALGWVVLRRKVQTL